MCFDPSQLQQMLQGGAMGAEQIPLKPIPPQMPRQSGGGLVPMSGQQQPKVRPTE